MVTDLQDLQYGTSSAKSMTLSFWVKSSITGTYAISFYKDDTTSRIINRSYTINSANTWEKKTISIVGDTDSTGSIVNDNGEGFRIIWGLASGSTYDGSTSTSWTNYTNAHFLGGHVQDGVVTTAGADWYLTGVQLEIGSSVTPFEHRPIGIENGLCQRYAHKMGVASLAKVRELDRHKTGHYTFPFEMRATPTVPTMTTTDNLAINVGRLTSRGMTLNTTNPAPGDGYGAEIISYVVVSAEL